MGIRSERMKLLGTLAFACLAVLPPSRTRETPKAASYEYKEVTFTVHPPRMAASEAEPR